MMLFITDQIQNTTVKTQVQDGKSLTDIIKNDILTDAFPPLETLGSICDHTR